MKPPRRPQFLTREQFKAAVFLRDRGKCVFCQQPAVDAHHILERKLFQDGGYYLGNGCAVCSHHHWECETTQISLDEVRRAAHIQHPILPFGFFPNFQYDKWGNKIMNDGTRIPGPLFYTEGAQKALAKGGKLELFILEDDYV